MNFKVAAGLHLFTWMTWFEPAAGQPDPGPVRHTLGWQL